MIVSLDGVGAYSHVRRAAMSDKLLSTPALHGRVPFVRMSCVRQSYFLWTDERGEVHDIVQGEGGEQGDPLMPALYA